MGPIDNGSTAEYSYWDAVCKKLYESDNAEERVAAERALADFSERENCLQTCMLLLESGTSSYAHLVAGTTLTKLISRPSSSISAAERIELRNYLLNFLVTRPKLPTFVNSALLQLFARLTKLGWFDYTKEQEYVFRNSVQEISKLAQESAEYCSLCIDLLAGLVSEINRVDGFGSVSRHRKVAASFRDVQLFDLFQLALSMLRDATAAVLNPSSAHADDNHVSWHPDKLSLVNSLMELASNCLTFDFIGSMMDDTSDDNVTVQVPTAWRVGFLDTEILQLFFSLFAALPSEMSAKPLFCLVQLASVRRTIFNNSERQQYLSTLMSGAKHILENPQKLSEQATYHEFCRLVARLKSNYQLSELIKVEDYPKIVRMLAEFTVQSLQMYQFSSNSIHYLLSFWQRMVSSMPYVKANEPHSLTEYAPLVTNAYISSRLTLAASTVTESMDNPLDDASSLHQQMEQISMIMRCEYEKTCQLLVEQFDASASAFQLAIQRHDDIAQKLQMTRLTWLVFLIGAAIGGRVAFSTSEAHDLIDGDLVCRVLQLMQLTDSRLADSPSSSVEGGSASKLRIEFAFIWMLEQFRKIYISDQVQKTSKVYSKLAECLGLNDEATVLAVFVRKIITNLKYWSIEERLVDETLVLLNDLSVGYSSVRKLVRLPEIQFLLNSHTSEHFSFLGTSADYRTLRCRSTFYTALTRLLAIDLGDDEEKFEIFMSPINDAMTEIRKIFTTLPSTSLAGQEEAKRAVVGAARDVRGVAFACNTRTTFSMLFDWIYPTHLAVFNQALEVWFDDPNVTSPLLKLTQELCQNRSQRLQFDCSSPNATLLFREASKFICSYGNQEFLLQGTRMLALTAKQQQEVVDDSQLYRRRLKGTALCFGVLRAALSGTYVNFGLFRLYGDNCLDNALSTFVQLLLAVPQQQMLAYSKLSQNYYYLMECLAQDHLAFISNLEPDIFVLILQTLTDGLSAIDTMVVTGCCSTLDLLVSYLYRRICNPGRRVKGAAPHGDNCLLVVKQHPHILKQMLSVLLNVMMFEECRAQWSMSRPLLGLILLQEEAFDEIKQQLMGNLPAAKQTAIEQCFVQLMDGVERNTSLKNKDRFTQNLSVFRRDVMERLKSTASTMTPNSSSVDMMAS